MEGAQKCNIQIVDRRTENCWAYVWALSQTSRIQLTLKLDTFYAHVDSLFKVW